MNLLHRSLFVSSVFLIVIGCFSSDKTTDNSEKEYRVQFDRPGVDQHRSRSQDEFLNDKECFYYRNAKITRLLADGCEPCMKTKYDDFFIGRIFSPNEKVSLWITAKYELFCNDRKVNISENEVREIVSEISKAKDVHTSLFKE